MCPEDVDVQIQLFGWACVVCASRKQIKAAKTVVRSVHVMAEVGRVGKEQTPAGVFRRHDDNNPEPSIP
jgi:hypothetical protein